MAASHSTRADGIRLTLGLLAAMLALAECVAVLVLVNRPAIVSAVGVPEGAVVWVTVGAVVATLVIVTSVLVGVTPRAVRY